MSLVKNQRVAIIGYAKTGNCVHRLLNKIGLLNEQIAIFDKNPPNLPKQGPGGVSSSVFSDPEQLMLVFKPEVLIVSPGVPLKTQWIQSAQTKGIKILSELDLASDFLEFEKIICVTGSIGKSTLVSLLEFGGQEEDPTIFAGGNLGTPLAEYILEVLNTNRQRAKWIILELSSFQLENLYKLQSDFSAITSLVPNHLERYENQLKYYKTKWKLNDLTRHVLVLNELGGDLRSFFLEQIEPATPTKVENKARIIWTGTSEIHYWKSRNFDFRSCRLVGEHNLQNLAMAFQISLQAGWSDNCRQRFLEFPGLKHRLENCGYVNGVQYINDSKSTTIHSTLAAVSSCKGLIEPKNQMFLLVGGRDKNLPWKELAYLNEVKKKNQTNHDWLQLVFFGECALHAKELSQLEGVVFTHLKPAIDHCRLKAKTGDLVLLSPAGSSLDEFDNFEHRGRFFKENLGLSSLWMKPGE